ncbi:MAG: Peptidoglycan glycosyltransferase, partial [Patescibacteria group bacterium]|nr:Peptidoglycan glycosyltransferase [Patescibacteria group bacterium]
MITTIIKELYHTFKKPIQIGILLGIGFLILIPIVTYLFFVRDLSSKENILSRKSAGVILLDRNEKPFFTFYQAKQQNTVPITE